MAGVVPYDMVSQIDTVATGVFLCGRVSARFERMHANGHRKKSCDRRTDAKDPLFIGGRD